MSKKSKGYEEITDANMKRARPIVQRYQILIWREDGEYVGRGVELPNVYGTGSTAAACLAETEYCLLVAVAGSLQAGESPPPPAIKGKRDQQINVRISAEEKVLLEAKANQRGAAGISEYIRAVALEK